MRPYSAVSMPSRCDPERLSCFVGFVVLWQSVTKPAGSSFCWSILFPRQTAERAPSRQRRSSAVPNQKDRLSAHSRCSHMVPAVCNTVSLPNWAASAAGASAILRAKTWIRCRPWTPELEPGKLRTTQDQAAGEAVWVLSGSRAQPGSSWINGLFHEIRSGPAILAPPVVATQHLPAKSFVHIQFQFQSAALGGNVVHEAFSVPSCRKAWRCPV
jgi:hypothetical protein